MVKNKTFYVTTTIPYVNAGPHIGHALEFVLSDTLVRWNRLLGKKVFFLTGTDEHGSKIYQLAKNKGIDTKEFVDKNVNLFKELLPALNISNDNFIRTTDQKAHWPGVFDIWKKLVKNKDIYKKKYSGKYCNGCERFVTELDLIDGKCPNHPNLELETINEENYFFKLSKYSKEITELIKKDKLEIFPEHSKNDFLSLIKDGLTDVSFSRDKKHLPWGIPVPGDKEQVMYVWCDALVNYLTGIGYPNKKYTKCWPADVHVVGKDMLRFHTGIWPGMLLAAGIPLPKKVVVHGFLTIDGQKMSKSLGNVIDPIALTKKYPSDSIRYSLLRATPFGQDGDFSEKALVERHNNELGNKLGNLVLRVSTLAQQNGMQIPKKAQLPKIKDLEKEVADSFSKLSFDKVLNSIFAYTDKVNEFLQSRKPWETKNKGDIYEAANAIKNIAILISPFIPETSEKIAKVFNFKLDIKQLNKPLKISKINKAPVLFEKIEIQQQTLVPAVEKPKDKVNKTTNIQGIMTTEQIKYEDFAKLDLRVGTILKAEDIEGADKLLNLEVDIGTEKRTILAGIKKYYKKEELIGKQVIAIVNLEPRKMKGLESQGMLLAAGDKESDTCILLSPEKQAKTGLKIS